jgi:hypothetical protein
MPANPYPTIATNLTTEESNITSAWGFAETELATQTAPQAIFLEIQWDGSAITRIFDSAQVSSLAQSEQLRLYPQLGGLFNLAMRNLLYP